LAKINNNEKSAEQSGAPEKTDKSTSGNFEAAEAVAAAAYRANPKAQEKFLEPKIEDTSLETFAKENSLWIEDYKEKFGENPHGQGAESDVYFSEDGKTAYKINSGIHHAFWVDFFNRIAAHNEYFPGTRYDLVGFTKKDGKLAIILRQLAIDAIRGATADEVKADIELSGFKFNGINNVRDEENGVTIRDLHDQNALINEDGNVVYIDPIIQFDKDSKYLKDRNRLGVS
jgi:hypothetical protein